MPLSPHARAHLRAALQELEMEVSEYVQEQVNAVHEGITPGTTTLDQITHAQGRANGAAELWAQMVEWAQEPEVGKSGVPTEML